MYRFILYRKFSLLMNQTSHNDADHFGKKNLRGDLFKDYKFYGCQYNVLCLWDKDGFSMINIYV